MLIHTCGFYILFKPILSRTTVDYIFRAMSLIIQILLAEFLKSSIKKNQVCIDTARSILKQHKQT